MLLVTGVTLLKILQFQNCNISAKFHPNLVSDQRYATMSFKIITVGKNPHQKLIEVSE